jgi:hypothetical protein
MGSSSPGRLKRDGREAFIPFTDPMERCPYKREYDTWRRMNWVEGWKEAERESQKPKPECEDLYEETTPQDGVIRLARWPEGYVLWHHGEIVWKEWG